MSQQPPAQGKNNGLASLLASTGDRWTQLAIIALVVLSGGGNLFATKSTADFNSTEIKRATEEVHLLYQELHASMDRQKDILAMLKDINRRIPQQP